MIILKSQESGEIALAWIAVPKLYPCILMTVFVPEGTVVVTFRYFVKMLSFLLIIFARLCWLNSLAVLAWQQDLVSFPQEKTSKI